MKEKYSLFLVLLIVLGFTSCSPSLRPDKVERGVIEEKVLYPMGADTARFQFLRGFTGNMDIEKQSKFQASLTGKKEIKHFIKPYGVFVENSKIYVSDIGLNGVNIIDLENETFEQFSPRTTKLGFTLSMTADTNGDMYFLETKESKVLKYDVNRKFQKVYDVSENKRPTRIRIKDDKVYIADLSGKINIYNKESFELIDQIPGKNVSNTDDGFIYMAMDFDLTDEYIYVIDAGDFKVKVYTYDGELIKSFGGYGNGYGLFIRPKSIAVDDEGDIMVVDSASGVVQVFNPEGEPLMSFGEHFIKDDGKAIQGLQLPVSMYLDYNNLEYYKPFVDNKYDLKYLVYVVSQSGRYLLKVYGRLELKSSKE